MNHQKNYNAISFYLSKIAAMDSHKIINNHVACTIMPMSTMDKDIPFMAPASVKEIIHLNKNKNK